MTAIGQKVTGDPVPKITDLDRDIARFFLAEVMFPMYPITPHPMQRPLVFSHVQESLARQFNNLDKAPSDISERSIAIVPRPKDPSTTPEFVYEGAASLEEANLAKYHWFVIDGNHRVHWLLLEVAQRYFDSRFRLEEIVGNPEVRNQVGRHDRAKWLTRIYSGGEYS